MILFKPQLIKAHIFLEDTGKVGHPNCQNGTLSFCFKQVGAVVKM